MPIYIKAIVVCSHKNCEEQCDVLLPIKVTHEEESINVYVPHSLPEGWTVIINKNWWKSSKSIIYCPQHSQ